MKKYKVKQTGTTVTVLEAYTKLGIALVSYGTGLKGKEITGLVNIEDLITK